jgi:hypothetical protein
MTAPVRPSRAERVEACALEADMAFFEARLSLAGDHPDTLYQLAQIKTYKTLGLLLADRLRAVRPDVDNASTTPERPAT